MISAKEMNELGLPNHPRIMPLAMKIINRALAAVIAAQSDLIDIVARFTPLLVKMAPDEADDRNKYHKNRKRRWQA